MFTFAAHAIAVKTAKATVLGQLMCYPHKLQMIFSSKESQIILNYLTKKILFFLSPLTALHDHSIPSLHFTTDLGKQYLK